MIEGATLNKDDYDITKLKNDNLNLSSYGNDSVNLTLSSIPVVTTETRVSMNVEATQKGTYYFNFTNLESFSPAMRIQLLDKFTQKTIDVRKVGSYTFVMDSLPHQWGKDRFVLVLNDTTFATTTAVKDIANEIAASYSLYPVPTNDVLNIAYKNNTAKNIYADVFDTKGNRVTGVVLNASGTAVTGATASAFYVSPVNQETSPNNYLVMYNIITGEMTRSAAVSAPKEPSENILTRSTTSIDKGEDIVEEELVKA
jgi:hypothetical protein